MELIIYTIGKERLNLLTYYSFKFHIMPSFREVKLAIYLDLLYSSLEILGRKMFDIGSWKEARGSSFHLSIIYFTKQYDKQYEHVQNDALNKFTTFTF